MKKWLFIIILLLSPVLKFHALAQKTKKEVSLETELKKLSNLENLSRYYDDSKSLQVSSYDRTGGNNDGFAGTYSYIRRNADSTLLIFEAKGKGVIDRIWTPTPTNDTLDFYFGDTATISFSIKFSDLFSGNTFPFIHPLCGNEIGGYYSYLPIPFTNGCKIVFRGDVMRFLQIQYRELGNSKQLKNFSMNLSRDEKQALAYASDVWNGNTKINQSDALLDCKTEVVLSPGNSKTIFNSEKGGRILYIEIEDAVLFENQYNNVDIKISYDDEELPAIYTPIADFFGYSFGSTSMQSIVMGTKNNTNYCYLPMPFDKKAKIELIYRESDINNELRFSTSVYYSNKKRDKKNEGKLYVDWNRVTQSIEGEPLTMANVQGKGHYIGTLMQTQNLNPGMTLFFEGDDIAIVDGENTIHGTGSEDYFNGGWYAFLDTWDRAMSLPIHGSLNYSLVYGRTGAYRWHLTDKISFNKSLKYDMEHGPDGNKEVVSNTTLGFYYCDTPKKKITEPTNELSKVYSPNTFMLYPQTMKLNLWVDVEMKTEWCLPSGGYTYIFKVMEESKIRVSLDELPEGKYKLYFDYKESPEGCEASLWQRQNQISSLINTYAESKVRKEKLFVCEVEVNDKKNTLTLRFKTRDDKNKFFLNRMIFEKI